MRSLFFIFVLVMIKYEQRCFIEATALSAFACVPAGTGTGTGRFNDQNVM